MGRGIPRSILFHDLLAIEIKILFLTVTIALNSNFIPNYIMDQHGILDSCTNLLQVGF